VKKIPTLFMRNMETDRLVRDEITPGCEWVLAGEGRATRKFDGTAVMVDDHGAVYRRFELQVDRLPRLTPDGFVEADRDDRGNIFGWVPVARLNPQDKWIIEGADNFVKENNELVIPEGTYELVGPKVNKNPEGYEKHTLVRHGSVEMIEVPVSFTGLRMWFKVLNTIAETSIEGIVWWHPDGRRAKLKLKDFGIKRSVLQLTAVGSA
jgi:hypothetical protein